MDRSTPKDQDPPHGGSFVRQPDGSLELKEGTKPAQEAPVTEPSKPAPQAGADEE
jgi:hypothetical protein